LNSTPAAAADHRDALLSGRRWHRRILACIIHDPSAAVSMAGRPMTRRSQIAFLLTAAVLAGSCGARSVRIAEIRQDPGRFDEKTIKVTGVVTSSFGVPLVPYQFYNVDDGSGEITILSRSARFVPSRGARVQVKGRVNQLGSFGTRSVGLHIQERDRNLKD
jgi:hypothetical protein